MGDLNVIFLSPYDLLSGQLFPVLTWLHNEWGVFCILYVHSLQGLCYGREYELVASERKINENLYMSHYKSINNTDINGPALSPQSLPRHSIIDISVSSSDSGCPLYICMPSIIPSHLLMSSGLALKSTHKTKHSSCCCFFVFIYFSIKHSTHSKVSNAGILILQGNWVLAKMPLDARLTSASVWQLAYGSALPPPAWVYASDLCQLGRAPGKQVSVGN